NWSAGTATGCRVKGKREGVWVITDDAGRVRERSTWNGGLRDGAYTSYHPSCQVGERGRYAEGQLEGAVVAWNASGVKLSEGTYKTGWREGTWTFYDSEDGTKQLSGPFVHGQGDGQFTEWFSVGTKWRDFPVKEGQRVGPETEACKARGGEWNVDYRSRVEGCKVENRAVGVWTTYYTSGAPRSLVSWVAGRIEGTTEELHPDGKLLHRGEYKNGVPVGVHEFHAPDGTLYGRSTVTGGNGSWKAFNSDGKVAEEGTFLRGQKEGVWTTYYDEGGRRIEVTYVGGVASGPYR